MGARLRTVRRTPDDDAGSGWLAMLPPRTDVVRVDGETRVDCAVIGAGFTGVAMARRLNELRPEWRTVVVDAQTVGFGASGRSSGVILDLNHRAASMPPTERDAYRRLSRSGIEEL
jgi:hypothetical protein